MTNYNKRFEQWAKTARTVETCSRPTKIKPGEIYWCSLGETIGSELAGKGPEFTRPVLILAVIDTQKVIVIPTTTKTKVGSHYHKISFANCDERISLTDLRIIDSKRLLAIIDTINREALLEIRKACLRFLKFHFYKKV